MSGDDETRGSKPLKLDQLSLEAIIEGVAAKLKKDCTHGKQGEHSGSLIALCSNKNPGEPSNSARLISLLHPNPLMGNKETNSRISQTKQDTALHSMAQHSMAQHGTAQHSMAQHSTAQHGIAQHGMAQHDTAWHGMAWHNAAWHGMAWHRKVR